MKKDKKSLEELKSFTLETYKTAIFKLYDYINRDVENIEDDYDYDYLAIMTGTDDNNYAWFYDGIIDAAINLHTLEIVTDPKYTEKLFC